MHISVRCARPLQRFCFLIEEKKCAWGPVCAMVMSSAFQRLSCWSVFQTGGDVLSVQYDRNILLKGREAARSGSEARPDIRRRTWRCLLFPFILSHNSLQVEICNAFETYYCSKEEKLCEEDEEPDAMFIVRHGDILLSSNGEKIAVAQRGAMFGEIAMLGLTETGRRLRTAVSLSECEWFSRTCL